MSDTVATEKTSMPEDRAYPPDWFWRIIDSARGDRVRLRAELEKLNRGALGRFTWIFQYASAELQGGDYATLCWPDASEDTIADAASRVIVRGKAAYLKALDAPAPGDADPDAEGSPGFLSEALLLYQTRYGHPVPPPPP